MPTRPPLFRRAFTLLELLVAMAITSVLIVVLVTLGISALDAWGGARSFARYQGSARAALDLLDSDLRSMISRPRLPGEPESSAPWLEIKYESSAGTTSATLSFFTQVTDIDPGLHGDLAAVHYKLFAQDPAKPEATDSPGNVVALYRKVATPESTLETALETTDLDEDFWPGQDVGNPVNLLAANVIILSVEFWVKGTDGVRRRADWGRGQWLRIDRNLHVVWEGSDESVQPFRLVGIDLAVEVVSDTGMQLLLDRENISAIPSSERRVFSQFVPVTPGR